MKRLIILLAILFALVLIFVIPSVAQEPDQESVQIAVKRSYVSNGVVIVTGFQDKTPLELQCNEGVSGCTVLQAGNYFMVRLPKNRGLYDCANVHVYRDSAAVQAGDRLGEYCLTSGK